MIRAYNTQKVACWITIVVYIGVCIPLGLYLAFKLGKKIEGMRIGMLIGQLLLTLFYSIFLECYFNWERVWREAHQHFNERSKSLSPIYFLDDVFGDSCWQQAMEVCIYSLYFAVFGACVIKRYNK